MYFSSLISRQSRHDNLSLNMKSTVDQMNIAQLNALASLSNLGSVNNPSTSAATMQAFQQQLFRGRNCEIDFNYLNFNLIYFP